MAKLTLGEYRARCVKTFGEDSETVKALDEQIQMHGDSEVEAKDRVFTGLLRALDFFGRRKEE